MTMMVYCRFAALLLACWFSTVLAGCARSPQVNFYALSPMVQAGAVNNPPAFSVAVAPVTLPELVDRPQLVLNTAGSRVDILEMHRWAEPLKNAIPRLLADNLSRLLGTNRISSYPQSVSNSADFRITADFLRFESTGDAVLIEALWNIHAAGDGPRKIRRFTISENFRDDANDARVAAYSRALAALSRAMADALLKEQQAASR
jgi:uncharacterized lipoprotein YmbA